MELTGFGTGLKRLDELGLRQSFSVVELTGFGTGLKLLLNYLDVNNFFCSCGDDRFWNGAYRRTEDRGQRTEAG